MNLITPPTDSLYKFMAISGMMSMIGGLVLLFTSIDTADELIFKYQGEENILQREIELLTDELDYNRKYAKLSDSLLSNYGSPSELSDSANNVVLYNLPDSVKNKFVTLLLKEEVLENKKAQADYQKLLKEGYTTPYLIMLYGGEIAALLGFGLWYDKIQVPFNKIQEYKVISEHNKLLTQDLWQKNCQSCLKTIRLINERGTESNGEYNKTYCRNCFQKGRFVEPDLEFDTALHRLKKELELVGYNRLKRNKYSKGLKHCLRWASKHNW